MQVVNKNLPPELLAQMEKPKDTIRKDTHTLCLVYVNECGPATVDELLVYVWKITGKVASRDYIYHVLHRLRTRKHLERVELEGETVVRHMLTPLGELYLEVEGLEYFKVESE